MDTQESYTGETEDNAHNAGFAVGRASAWHTAQSIISFEEKAPDLQARLCPACVLRGSLVSFAQALAQDLQKADAPDEVLRDHLIDLIDHALETPAPQEAVKH